MGVASTRPGNLPAIVDCRYRQAAECDRSGRQLRRSQSDPVTFALAEVLRRRSAGESGRGHMPPNGDRRILRAVEIFKSGDVEKVAMLEAYLVSDLSYAEIAIRVSEAPEVVELYAKCFFDVRNENSAGALNLVVAAYKDVPPDQLISRYLWKRISLGGDLAALESLMSPPEIHTVGDMVRNTILEAREIALHKVAVAVKEHDIGDAAAIGELRQMLDEMRAAQPDDAHSYLLQQIDGIFTSLGFSVAERSRDFTAPELAKFQGSAVELSGMETQRLALGSNLENQDQLLSVRFPDPPESEQLFAVQPVGEQPGTADPNPPGSEAHQICDDFPAEQLEQSHLATPANGRMWVMQRVERVKQTCAEEKTALLEEERIVAEQVRKLELRRRDLEWKQQSHGRTGGVLHRLRLQFSKKYPGYIPPEVRETLQNSPRG